MSTSATTTFRNPAVQALTEALAAPFSADEVKFKPLSVRNNRALALAYVDARAIQDRLDAVLGAEAWQDEYESLPDGAVICRLRLRLGSDWITKMDVGSPSGQPDSGDRRKAAFSDALKRAAVKFGIGRYLHRVTAQWCDYDPVKKQFVRPPSLPSVGANRRAEATPSPAPAAAPPPKTGKAPAPATGTELAKRLTDFDIKLANQGLCAKGALLLHVRQAGIKAGHGPEMAKWSDSAIQMAITEALSFESGLRQRQPRSNTNDDKMLRAGAAAGTAA